MNMQATYLIFHVSLWLELIGQGIIESSAPATWTSVPFNPRKPQNGYPFSSGREGGLSRNPTPHKITGAIVPVLLNTSYHHARNPTSNHRPLVTRTAPPHCTCWLRWSLPLMNTPQPWPKPLPNHRSLITRTAPPHCTCWLRRSLPKPHQTTATWPKPS